MKTSLKKVGENCKSCGRMSPCREGCGNWVDSQMVRQDNEKRSKEQDMDTTVAALAAATARMVV